MAKVNIGPKTFLYPMPTTIIGSHVDGEPNFITVAYCGIAQNSPPMVSISIGKHHYSNRGITDNACFSVNIPSSGMLEVTDFIGMNTGSRINKSNVFNVFYGELKAAPMIKDCPLCLECKLADIRDYGGASLLCIGEITEAHIEEDCLVDGLPDIKRLDPIIFSMHDNTYWKLGEKMGDAWSVGRHYSFHEE